MTHAETIRTLGENESLKRTIARLNTSEHALVGPGDDSAVIAAPDGRFVVTTDTMIEDHDFKLDWSTGYDLGWKAVASNVADVAAMGAVPTSLVVALAVPADTEISWLEAFADGLRDACQKLAPGCGVVGGDLAAANQVMISVAAHGSLEGREPVLRSGAQVGDIVAVAGTLGRAAAGLALLQSANVDAINSYDTVVNTQRRPNPPVAEGVAAAIAGATSMLDLSDGLAKDGLTDVYDKQAMGVFADKTAAHFGITREAQDAFAIRSYQRVAAATAGGQLSAEIVPVSVASRKGEVLVTQDEEYKNVKFDKIPSLRADRKSVV